MKSLKIETYAIFNLQVTVLGNNWGDHDFGNAHRIILLVLLNEGPLTLNELEERASSLNAYYSLPSEIRERREKRRTKRKVDLPTACNTLVEEKYVYLTQDNKYVLTEAGKAKAEDTAKAIDRGANILEKHVLTPQATARNTIIAYFFLSVLKLTAGLFGGSVGLIADGSDTSVDTASAGVVWLGIKFKKEMLGTIVILVLMFATAASLFYASANSIIQNINGTFLPMSEPYMVIIVEGIAMLSAFTFSIYQRLVGRRSKSLALISQSIDSQNSVYSAIAVIAGAVFSLFGVYWVDAVVGGFIALKISLNGVALMRQAINSMKGQEPDFDKFKLPFEEQIEIKRRETFRNWILYSIHKENLHTKPEIIRSLERTFKPKFVPALFAELTMGKQFDFENNFSELITPLLDEEYLRENEGVFTLTEKGKGYLRKMLSAIKYHQSEL